MNTLLPQIPRTEVTGLDLAMGVLTINQAAVQLAEFFTADPILQTWRLICRGSLPAIQVAGEWRVPLDALKSFLVNGAANTQMRKELGLPAETVAPIFPWSGQWYDQTLWHYPIMQMLAGLSNEISKQLPATPDDVLALAARAKSDPRDNLNVNAEITPLMASLLRAAVPAAGGVFDMPDGSMFLNLGEIYLCQQLQEAAARIIRLEAQADSQNIKPEGFGPLYTLANYNRLVNAALASDIRGGVSASKVFPPMNLYGKNRVVSINLVDRQVRQITGTTPERLASLAF